MNKAETHQVIQPAALILLQINQNKTDSVVRLQGQIIISLIHASTCSRKWIFQIAGFAASNQSQSHCFFTQSFSLLFAGLARSLVNLYHERFGKRSVHRLNYPDLFRWDNRSSVVFGYHSKARKKWKRLFFMKWILSAIDKKLVVSQITTVLVSSQWLIVQR